MIAEPISIMSYFFVAIISISLMVLAYQVYKFRWPRGKAERTDDDAVSTATPDPTPSAEEPAPDTPLPPAETAEALIRQLGTSFEMEDAEEERDYSFRYQNGHYLLRLDKKELDGRAGFHRMATLYYLHMASVEPAGIGRMRATCNRINELVPTYKAFYTVRKGDGDLSAHLSSHFFLTDAGELQQELFREMVEGFFTTQRFFVKALDEVTGLSPGDLERKYMYSLRQLSILRESLARDSQDDKPEMIRMDRHSSLTAGDLFSLLDDTPTEYMETLHIAGRTPQLVREPEAIEAYPLFDIVNRLKRDEVVVLTATFRPQDLSGGKKIGAAHILVEDIVDHTAYLHILYMGHYIRSRSSRSHGQEAASSTRSLRIPFDLRPAAKRLAEYEYMRSEAMELMEKGHEDRLTDEQRLMVGGKLPEDSAFCLYWGERYYFGKHYAEALIHLLPVWRDLNRLYPALGPKGRATFCEVTFHIGICYNIIGKPEMAYYYLDALTSENNTTYLLEYIKALKAKSDYRVLPILKRMIRNIREQLRDIDKEQIPESIREFYEYLRREYARQLEYYDRTDEAKKIYEEMLDEPGNCDYAITRLAQIQEEAYRQKQEEAAAQRKKKAEQFEEDEE